MTHLTKLTLAVVLALVAAGMNALWLSARKSPPTFVAVKVDAPEGQEIAEEMLASVPVPGDSDKLRQSLIPYESRAIIYGMKAPRSYVAGDMVFQRDLQAPRQLSKFEVLGPFQLISVGERFKVPSSEQQDSQVSEGGNNVTIAVDANFDERTRRLLEIIDPSRRGNSPNQTSRIVAVQVIPKNEQLAAEKPASKNTVYQTISLDGIENVPRVLLNGDVIRFVIPASDSL